MQQFTDIAVLRLGPPVMGRLPITGGLPAGLEIPIHRGEVILAYTVLRGEYTAMIVNAPQIRVHGEEIRRQGVNLAALALALLRMPEFMDRARAARLPRLNSLLDAVGDALETGDGRHLRFAVDGEEAAPLRLDEIALPAGTPANPADEDPP